MQKNIRIGLIMAGVIIIGTAVGTVIAKVLDPKMAYLLYRCGCESSDEGEL